MNLNYDKLLEKWIDFLVEEDQYLGYGIPDNESLPGGQQYLLGTALSRNPLTGIQQNIFPRDDQSG